MGCFSFLCNECGRGIRSSSFDGEKCRLYLLENGKVLQEMRWEYNSYGAVFIDGTQRKDVKHSLRESVEWKNPHPNKELSESEKRMFDKKDDHWIWLRVCDLIHDEENPKNGIAAVHEHCFKSVPKISSVGDPNQGWGDGDEEEDEGNLFSDGPDSKHTYKPQKPVEGFDVVKEHKIIALEGKIWRAKSRVTSDALFFKNMMEAILKGNKEGADESIKALKNQEEAQKKEYASLCKQYKKLTGREYTR